MPLGGYGSGRAGGQPTSGRTASLTLSTTQFRRAGVFKYGMRSTASFSFGAYEGTFPIAIVIDTTDRHSPYLELAHESRSSRVSGLQRYEVGLQTSPQPFGGARWWFVCPRTRRRAVRLFLPLGGHQFWSRQAYRLGYSSQRQDPMGCAQLQAEKIYRQLGGEGHWMDDPPPKPKWMRWRTYERKVAKLEYYCARYDAAWSAGLGKLMAKSG